jgi:hypothetical protein
MATTSAIISIGARKTAKTSTTARISAKVSRWCAKPATARRANARSEPRQATRRSDPRSPSESARKPTRGGPRTPIAGMVAAMAPMEIPSMPRATSQRGKNGPYTPSAAKLAKK